MKKDFSNEEKFYGHRMKHAVSIRAERKANKYNDHFYGYYTDDSDDIEER